MGKKDFPPRIPIAAMQRGMTWGNSLKFIMWSDVLMNVL